MINVLVPNVALKVLSKLLKVVIIEENWDSQPMDMTWSLAVGHVNVA